MSEAEDARWMAAALALAGRGRGPAFPNPSVGCLIVKDGRVVGRGWTQAGGRPHAEAMALDQAGDASLGATVYGTLEPCAHVSPRGPDCASILARAKPGRVVIAMRDPNPATNGKGVVRLQDAGLPVFEGVGAVGAARAIEGFLLRLREGRPHLTLKLATSLDGGIARADGESRWITGPAARAHAHLVRAQCQAIVVGRGTFEADRPALDVRLPGLEQQSPAVRAVLSSGSAAPEGWYTISAPSEVTTLPAHNVLIEGGAGAAAAFLRADLVDRLILYRAPILIGNGRPALSDVGLGTLADAHGRWRLDDARMLGSDRLEVYERVRG